MCADCRLEFTFVVKANSLLYELNRTVQSRIPTPSVEELPGLYKLSRSVTDADIHAFTLTDISQSTYLGPNIPLQLQRLSLFGEDRSTRK